MIRSALCKVANSSRMQPRVGSLLRRFTAVHELAKARHLKDWRKEDIMLWKLKLFEDLSLNQDDKSPLEIVYENFDALGELNRYKVPDFIYCSAIHLLLSRNCVQEAFSLLVQANLNSVVLDIGTYEFTMRTIKEQRMDKSYLVVCFNMLVENFSPNSRIEKILRSVKIDMRSSDDGNLYTLLDSQSRKKIAESNGSVKSPSQHQHTAQTPFEPQTKIWDTEKTAPRPQNKATYISPSGVEEWDSEKYQKIHQSLESLSKPGNIMVLMPSSFDIKDDKGNLLFTVESNDFYSEDDDYFSEEEEDDQDGDIDGENSLKGPKNTY